MQIKELTIWNPPTYLWIVCTQAEYNDACRIVEFYFFVHSKTKIFVIIEHILTEVRVIQDLEHHWFKCGIIRIPLYIV